MLLRAHAPAPEDACCVCDGRLLHLQPTLVASATDARCICDGRSLHLPRLSHTPAASLASVAGATCGRLLHLQRTLAASATDACCISNGRLSHLQRTLVAPATDARRICTLDACVACVASVAHLADAGDKLEVLPKVLRGVVREPHRQLPLVHVAAKPRRSRRRRAHAGVCVCLCVSVCVCGVSGRRGGGAGRVEGREGRGGRGGREDGKLGVKGREDGKAEGGGGPGAPEKTSFRGSRCGSTRKDFFSRDRGPACACACPL